MADDIELVLTAQTSEAKETHQGAAGTDEAGLDGPQINIAEREDVPPDGGYGWVCTACVFMVNAHTWGVNSAWAIFLARYLAESTFPGATQLEYALIGGLSISQALLISPIVAFSNNRFGIRTTMVFGTALVSASMLASSFASSIQHLILSWACFGYGLGFLYMPATAVLPQWFSQKRSLAVGIASSGVGCGGIVYSLATGAAIESLGLPWTYRILAVCTGIANLTSSLLLEDRNKIVMPQKHAFNFREFGHISVLLVIIWGVFTELGYITLVYSLPSYGLSIGLSPHQGSIIGAMSNVGLAIGRPVVGFLSDTFGRINIAAIMTVLCGIFCLALWVPAKTYAVLLVFALAAGTVMGTFWGTVVPITAEVVGLQRLPSAFGIICIPLVLPTTFAEPIALQIVSGSGYLSAQIFVGFMMIAGAISLLVLRSWKICDMEKTEILERDGYRSPMPSRFWLTARRLISTSKV